MSAIGGKLTDPWRAGGPVAREIELLRWIDQEILKIDRNTKAVQIERLFNRSISDFRQIYSPTLEYEFLVYIGPGFQPLNARSAAAGRENDFSECRTFAEFTASEPVRSPRLLSPRDDKRLFSLLKHPASVLVSPVYTPTNDLLCLLVVTARTDDEAERLADNVFQDGIAAVTAQLTIAYGHYEKAALNGEFNRLWTELLAHNLSPIECFRILAERIAAFLPSFGPLKLPAAGLHAQILMLASGAEDDRRPDFLVIRGTTGTEHSGTRVAIERSISGRLILDPQLPFFCDDPSKDDYPLLYRNYFSERGQQARTEFVFRLKRGAETVGLVNLESREPNAFSHHHRQRMLALAGPIGAFAAVFEQRLNMNTGMQNSVATSTKNYLEALAGTFDHAVSTPLASQRGYADLLSTQLANAKRVVSALKESPEGTSEAVRAITRLEALLEGMHDNHAELLKAHQETFQFVDDFLNDIASYADETQKVLRDLVDAAIRLANDSLLSNPDTSIRIKLTQDKSPPNTRVFCSTLVKQHLYSIFHNAVDAIYARMKNDKRPGRISVSITEDKVPEDQETRLNRAWRVRIRDNGTGVTPEQLEKLRRFEPGTTFKGAGNGYGLTAAQRYFASIGARVTLNSEPGQYFETSIYFDEYKSEIHNTSDLGV